jgi:hypothetical protein
MRPKTSATLVLAGAATLLAACAADPGYDPSQFAYGYPAYAAPAQRLPGLRRLPPRVLGRRLAPPLGHDRWHGGHR